MKRFERVEELRRYRRSLEAGRPSVGFVPTMGALHEGHLTLVEQSRRENDRTVVSIFVNPTQFDRSQDLEDYPRDVEADAQRLLEVGVDALFLPQESSMYPSGYRTRVVATEDVDCLCGSTRPGHFDGVLTVVLKLLQLVRPHRVYLGEKDFQQLRLVRSMAADLFLDVEVIGVPTVREADGLAMSSRNLLLSPEERSRAPELHRWLCQGRDLEEARRGLEAAGFRIDYLEERWGRRLAAAFLGHTRLIDNVSWPTEPTRSSL